MLNIASQTTISYSQINLADIKEPSTSIIENENVLYPKLSIIESIFEFYKSLYFSKELRGRSIPFQKSKAVILNTLFVGQMISLFWVPEMNIHGWNEHFKFWKHFGMLRLDHTCAMLDISEACTYVFFALILLKLVSATTIIILIWKGIKVNDIFIRFSKTILDVFSNVFLIPALVQLLLCLKYKLIQKSNVEEYYDNNAYSNFEVHTSVAILVFLMTFLCFIMTLFRSTSSGEIRHSFYQLSLTSRAHSKIEMYNTIYVYTLIVFYVIFGSDNILYFQIISVIFSLWLLIATLKYLPYYWTFYTCVISIRYFVLFFVSALFILGAIFDHSLFIILTSVFIIPIGILFVIAIVFKLESSITLAIPSFVQRFIGAYELEKQLRKTLCSSDLSTKEGLINILADTYLETKLFETTLLAVWECNYCFYTLNDETLARIKLSKSKKSNFDLEGEYRKFVCNKMFAEIGVSDCTKFMYYVNQVDLVKKEDEKLCSVLKDFWRELVLINPRLSKLLNLMAIVTKSIHLLNTEYSKLLSTFTKSTEVLYYYSTLLENVLSDSQKSLELTNKKNFLEKFLLQNSRINKKLTFFDDNNGIFIISWEKQAIGKILYANSKSANILCLPMEELVGMNMQNFIPPPYDHNFNENVYHYLNRTTKSDLILPRQIYLMIQNGCLVECDFNASLTFMFNRLVIVVVIRERKTTHQVALIDENLEILAHTQRFSDFFGMRSKDLRGSIMYSIIPELEYVCLLPFCPLILSIENVDVQLVSCYREICGKRIDYVILMNDPEEIQAWKRREAEELQDYSQQSNHIFDTESPVSFKISLDHGQELFEDTDSLTHVNARNKKKRRVTVKTRDSKRMMSSSDNLEMTNILSSGIEDENSKQSGNLSNSSTWIHHNMGLKIMQKSSKSLNWFNCILILSVIVVLATNGAVLFYTSSEVSRASDMSIPIILGNIAKAFNGVSISARSIYVLTVFSPNTNISMYQNSILDDVEILKEIRVEILNNLDTWNSCSSREIFSDEVIPVWKNDGLAQIEKMNMVKLLSEFISAGNSLIEKYEKKLDYSIESQFIILNGLGESLHYTNHTLFNLIDCEVNNIKDLVLRIDVLLGVGFGVLILCTCILVPFFWNVERMVNKFWNHIKKCAYESYFDLKKACYDRLFIMHGQSDQSLDENMNKKLSKRGNFKSTWKYTWRIALYLIITLIFFVLNITYLYHHCSEMLSLRPQLIRSIINSHILHKIMICWSREVLLTKIPSFGVEDMMPYHYQFSEPTTEFFDILNKIKDSNNQLRRSEYEKLIYGDYTKLLFENIESTNPYFFSGLYAAENIITQDNIFLSFNSNTGDLWFTMMDAFVIGDDQFEKLVKKADNDSQKAIEAQLNYIIILLIIYGVTSFVLYLCFCLPFVKNEEENIKMMQIIWSIIPMKSLSSRRTQKFRT